MLAPIVLFVYNRPEHTKKTIESLARNYLAKDSVLIVFSDGKKESDSTQNVEKTRQYIRNIKNKKKFSEVIIEESPTNKGLANSVISGVTKVIRKYGKVIVMEDDLESHPYFLKFMNDSLNYYENYKDIWSISGYTIPISIPSNYKEDVFITRRSSSWGWGTWLKNWKETDWEVRDYQKFKKNRLQRRDFNKGGKDLSYLLDDQMNRKVDSWAIRWYYSQYKMQKYTIYPVKSLIKNIGLDGSGTHSGKNKKYNVEFNNDEDLKREIKLIYPDLNSQIIKEFRNYYLSIQGLIYRKIKSFINK